MNYWEIYRDTTMNPKTGMGVQELEIHVGAETSTLYSYQAHHSGTFERICNIIEADAKHGGADLLRAIAHNAGFSIVDLGEVEEPSQNPMRIASATLQSGSNAIQDYIDAWEDGEITEDERERVGESIALAIEKLQTARASLNEKQTKSPRRILNELVRGGAKKFDQNGHRTS